MRPGLVSDRFSRGLLLVVLVGALLRVAYVVTVTRHDEGLYDATWYELTAQQISDGVGWFVDPFLAHADADDREPSADHPPLTVVASLPAALVADGDAGGLLMRLTMVAFGSGTIAVVGLLGRRLAGPDVGLLAATIACVDPQLWMNDGLIMSESVATLLTTVTILGTVRMLSGDRRLLLAGGLGALVGLAALARAELLLLGVLLLPPALAVTRRHRLWPRAGAALAACVIVLAPWVTYNLSRFEEPAPISTTLGLALSAGNCDAVYDGPLIGWAAVFPPCTPVRGREDPSVWDARLRGDAISYMADHTERVPAVVVARVGRLWHVYRIGQTIDLGTSEGRPAWASWAGALVTWALVPLGVAGGVALRRRREHLWPLVVPIAATTIVAAALSGLPRYRAPSEPALVVLAAIGIWTLNDHLRRRDPRAPAELTGRQR